MKKRIIILGAGLMQMPAITIAKKLGFHTVVLDGDPDAPCKDLADRFEHIDLKDKEAILDLAIALKAETSPTVRSADRLTAGSTSDLTAGLAGIMTSGTDFSASVAYVAEKLALPGIPYEAALDASDKGRMRTRFAAAGVPSPAFVVLTADDVSRAGVKSARGTDAPCLPALKAYSIPKPGVKSARGAAAVVVKPVDNMGGRGCRRVDNEDELREAVTDALRFSRSSRVIVEEYMDGPEFSVDAIVYDGEITICGLADRHIFYPPYFIEMGHTMPTEIEPEQQKAILDTFIAGVRALGIERGAAKGDIKLTAQGPMIGEIAARLSGGYMSGWTYPYASGAEPTAGAILVAAGEKPHKLKATKNWTSAERAFISIPGVVGTINGMDSAGKIARVKNIFLTVREGSVVNFPENNVGKCGNVISAAPARGEAVEAAESAARSILIRLRPHQSATDDFLAMPLTTRFPPSAFSLTEEIHTALSGLPREGEKFLYGRRAPLKKNSPPLALRPFPLFQNAGLKDYAGRTVDESLDAVRALTGLPLPVYVDGKTSNTAILGPAFWRAIIRGGYQGALYVLDCLTPAGGNISMCE
jgi:biotin carboxylase